MSVPLLLGKELKMFSTMLFVHPSLNETNTWRRNEGKRDDPHFLIIVQLCDESPKQVEETEYICIVKLRLCGMR